MAKKTKRLCSSCGAEISARAKICPNRGAAQKTKQGHVPIMDKIRLGCGLARPKRLKTLQALEN